MYKKPVSLSGEHALGGAERKKLRRTLAAAFGVDEGVLDALLPPKADIRVAKVASPSRASVYSVDGAPLFVDTSSKGDLLPCLPALWRAPGLLPSLTLRHADVAHFVLNGADLMLPGVQRPLPDSLPEGALCAVRLPGSVLAIAVGSLCVGTAQAAAMSAGRLLALLHHQGDCLCALAPPHLREPPAEPGAVAASCPPADEGAPLADAAPVTSPAEMDALLLASLLQALSARIKDSELPIAASTLWASHVLPSRPAGALLDVKRSSHRKVGAFVASCAASGLLTAREERGGELAVTSVNRRHEALLGHTPHECEPVETEERDWPPPPLVVQELFLPSAFTRPLWLAVGSGGEEAQSAAEAGAVLRQYVAAHCTSAATVTLDPLLADALFQGALKKEERVPTHLSWPDLTAQFLARCTCVHRVARGPSDGALLRGALPQLVLRHASRAGKKVTVAVGFEAFLIDGDALAAQLRAAFAASVTLTELPRGANAKKGPPPRELMVQGERGWALGELLKRDWGVPARCVALPPGCKPDKK